MSTPDAQQLRVQVQGLIGGIITSGASRERMTATPSVLWPAASAHGATPCAPSAISAPEIPRFGRGRLNGAASAEFLGAKREA